MYNLSINIFSLYMSTRKYLSGYEKLLKNRKIEKQIESQKGSMDKFVTSIKKNTIESSPSQKARKIDFK